MESRGLEIGRRGDVLSCGEEEEGGGVFEGACQA